eukprot:100168-Hanusia_phi.AAC.1
MEVEATIGVTPVGPIIGRISDVQNPIPSLSNPRAGNSGPDNRRGPNPVRQKVRYAGAVVPRRYSVPAGCRRRRPTVRSDRPRPPAEGPDGEPGSPPPAAARPVDSRR